MFCAKCGMPVKDGEHFCSNCGAPLQDVGAVTPQAPGQAGRGYSGGHSQDPYKEQIQELRLQIRQLKLDLRQINTSMGRTRAHYNQTRAFLPWSLRRGSKWFEDIRLLGKQPQKEQLQRQLADLQQQLLELEEAQMDWKRQQQSMR